MGFFDILKDAFSKLFGSAPHIQFNDTELQTSIHKYPQSLSDYYRNYMNEIAENLHQVYTAANNREFTIGIIGDFTVGKSSFINAILGDRILPVSANPTTAIITKIKYGCKPKVVVRYKNGDHVEMTYEDFLKFSAFNLKDFQERNTTGSIQRFEDVVDAVMYVKSEFLKTNNLCIVDTLGLSAHESDNQKTITSIRDSIATIYVCSERGLSDKDVDFISTYLSPERDDFFLCINRIDLVRKSEREALSQLVKLKIDNILNKAGHTKDFLLSRIYQVSSLYQEFANGFTDHDEWHKGVNYQELSGFIQIMNDVGQYVKENANVARKETINKQLQNTQKQLTKLMVFRKDELERKIAFNDSKISTLNTEIQKITTNITKINTLFETLFNTIYSFSNNFFYDFSKNVNNEWEDYLNNSLIKQVAFGFGDYVALEKDILALKLNVFKSMSDKRYAKLLQLSQFVEPTTQFLKDKLHSIANKLVLQILNSIESFATQHSFLIYFDKKANFNNNALLTLEQKDVIFAMYRSVALAAIESTWTKNKNRKIKMFNAAKTESLKTAETPISHWLKDFYLDIQQYLNGCNTKAIKFDVNNRIVLTQQVNDLTTQNLSTKEQIEQELSYFNNLNIILNKNKYPSNHA